MAKMLNFQPAKRLLQNAYQRGPVQVYVSFIIFFLLPARKASRLCYLQNTTFSVVFFQQKY